MRIEFVNHASIIVESGSIRLMCDFWRDGDIFDNGWSLLCETQLSDADLASITHLWFSHEHPDHFSPPNTRAIPEQFRKNITVLFQETKDKRLIEYCKRLGFKEIIELSPDQTLDLGDDVSVRCEPYGATWGDVDSWLLVKTPGGTLLNINDCEIHDEVSAKKLRDELGPVDILATQFSYASKQGDAADPSWIERARAFHSEKLDIKVRSFGAKSTILFASFVYFSHEENRYLNDGVIRVHDVLDLVSKHSRPVVMYPGDRWSVADEWNNDQALARYGERYDEVAARPADQFIQTKLVAEPELLELATKFLGRLSKGGTRSELSDYIGLKHARARSNSSGPTLLRKAKLLRDSVRKRAEPARFWVKDHDRAYELTLDGFAAIPAGRQECQIAISSEALASCFRVSWGGETLQINGRFDNLQSPGWEYVRAYFFLERRLQQEHILPVSTVLDSALKSLR